METFNYTEENYNPVLITEKWQVAYLNSCPEYELKAIKKVDVHENTDEAFVLLEGKAVLILPRFQLIKPNLTLLIWFREPRTIFLPECGTTLCF